MSRSTTTRPFERSVAYGEALGRGLIELHDVLVDPTDASLSALVNRDGRVFLSSLWKVLAFGLNNAWEGV